MVNVVLVLIPSFDESEINVKPSCDFVLFDPDISI